VKDNGFVFGAYTHCKWSAPKAAYDPVTDPSGQSFLFSLVNATGKAVRFSLRDKDGAIQLGGSNVSFGVYNKDAKGRVRVRPNFELMYCGREADQPTGNFAHANDAHSSYRLDDAAVKCDSNMRRRSEPAPKP